MSEIQIIEKSGKPEYAVLPYREYLRLLEAAEDAEDIRAIETFHQRLAAGKEELLPAEFVHRLLDAKHPLPLWREHRGLTQAALAKAAGIRPAYLSQIESGARTGSARVLRALAKALRVDVDDLLRD